MTKEEIQYEAQSIIQKWGSNDSAPYVEFVEKLASMELSESFSDLDKAADTFNREDATRMWDYEGKTEGEIVEAAFKAGAEWMAEQGFLFEDRILFDSNTPFLEDAAFDIPESQQSFKNGDKVIVQIRKNSNHENLSEL